jgi:hypothetical protein
MTPFSRVMMKTSLVNIFLVVRGGAATVGDFGGKNGYMLRILEKNKINGGELPFLSPILRARSPIHVFLFRPESPSASRKAGDGLDSPNG